MSRPTRLAFFAIALVMIVWASAFAAIYLLIPSWETRGQFGDLFGSVNSLFSGLAFAILIYTLRVQIAQLELQREELRLQREEIRANREELAKSALAQQNLVERQIVASQIAGVSAILQGRYALEAAYPKFNWLERRRENAEFTLLSLLRDSGLDTNQIE